MHPERSVLDRVRVPKNQRSARAPRAAASSVAARDAARGTPPRPSSHDVQQGGSPLKEEAAEEQVAPLVATQKVPDAASGSPRSGASAAAAQAEGPTSAPAAAAAVPASRAVAPAASAAPAAEPRRRESHPASPRNQRPAAPEGKAAAAGRGEKSAPAPHSPRSAASQHAAKATIKSPKQRAADAASSKGALQIPCHPCHMHAAGRMRDTQLRSELVWLLTLWWLGTVLENSLLGVEHVGLSARRASCPVISRKTTVPGGSVAISE